MSKKNNLPIEEEFSEVEEISEKKIISVEGFGEEEAANLTPLFQKFLKAYGENKIDETLREELGEETAAEIQKNVANWNSSINDINNSCAEGMTAEEWFAKKLNDSAIGVNSQDYEKYLSGVLENLHNENFNALKTLDLTKHLGKENEFVSVPALEIPEQLGREVQVSELAGMILNSGWKLAEKYLPDGKFEEVPAIIEALRGGDDSGVKSAAVAALTSAVEKGNIPILPKGTPVEAIAGIACFGVEQAKIMLRFADGDISSNQALVLISRAAVVNASFVMGKLGEKIGRQVGQKIGTMVGAIIPALAPVGAVVGSYVGAAVGKIAGSKIGKVLGKAAEKLSKAAEPFILRTCNTIKTLGRKFKETIRTFTALFE